MNLVVSKSDIKMFERLAIISRRAPILEHTKQFERKYNVSFPAFEKQIMEKSEEFERWDDYIEWKAYIESLKDLDRQLQDIENAQGITITEY
jgi:hypothetical protein